MKGSNSVPCVKKSPFLLRSRSPNESRNSMMRLVSRLEVADETVNIKALYERFCFELLESSGMAPSSGLRRFLGYLEKLYPNIERKRTWIGSGARGMMRQKSITFYKGIRLKDLQPLIKTETLFSEISAYICEPVSVKRSSETELVCTMETGCFSNGLEVNKTLVFQPDKRWLLQIASKTIDLSSIYIDNSYDFTKESIETVCAVAATVELCPGKPVTATIPIHRRITLEYWKYPHTTTIRSIRAQNCKRVVPLYQKIDAPKCIACYKSTVPKMEEKSTEEDKRLNQIRHFLKNANPALVELFMEQCKNVSRSSTGQRWSNSFISTCAQLYSASPRCYKLIQASKMLVLPGNTTIEKYRKSIEISDIDQNSELNENEQICGSEEEEQSPGSDEDEQNPGLDEDEQNPGLDGSSASVDPDGSSASVDPDLEKNELDEIEQQSSGSDVSELSFGLDGIEQNAELDDSSACLDLDMEVYGLDGNSDLVDPTMEF